ncbi:MULTISPECIES: STAS domain-containing protein [Streptomyces]|uniref:STAS domain-containing protein n=1 Tax=Streptomyces apricus TaxID=1828112 RepID=A0A5B0BG14_9ACTN|nr:STAS domain-containing protein [Streptomyces apricus]KAA0941084.1 STAS domain-containing protein [Streptomyces apricus]
MTTPLTLIPGQQPDGSALLTVVGEIDTTNTAALGEALDGIEGPLVVDLTGVEYLDSAGLSTLFAHSDRIQLIATPLLEPVLAVSGITELVTVHGLTGGG